MINEIQNIYFLNTLNISSYSALLPEIHKITSITLDVIFNSSFNFADEKINFISEKHENLSPQISN